MKHIRTFESYKSVKSKLGIVNDSVLVDAIKESVLQVGDLYKVRSMVDIPQSLINSYVKKVKDTTGKNLRQFFGDVEIAEQLLQFITTTGLDIEKIPGNALMGGAQAQGQAAQGVQVQTQAETGEGTEATQEPAAAQGQAAQTEPVQGQAPAGEEFEEPAAAQGQAAQGQAAEGQAAQGQAAQGQAAEGQAAQGQAAQGQAAQGQAAQGQAAQGQAAQGQAAQGQEEEEEGGEEELPL